MRAHAGARFYIRGKPLLPTVCRSGRCGWRWGRASPRPPTRGESSWQKRERLRALPIEEKKSLRWLEGLRQAREVAPQLPIETIEQVQTILQDYTVRFLIEVQFRVLKSGCRVERRLLEHLDRLLPCLAVYWIVAWRTLMLCRLGRSHPDLDCEAVLEPAEWKSVGVAVHRRPAPSKPPRLLEMLKLVAQLGGYVNYPNRKDPPGPQTLWLGLQRVRDLAWGWNAFGPGAATTMSQTCV